jgi:hypothetical protein
LIFLIISLFFDIALNTFSPTNKRITTTIKSNNTIK